MMKCLNILIFTFCLFSGLTSLAQNKIYKEEYNLNTGLRLGDYSVGKTLSYYSDGVVYSIMANGTSSSDNLKILAFETKSKISSIYTIRKSKSIRKLFDTQIDAIAALNGKVVLIAFEYIYIFKLDKNKELKVHKILPNKGSFQSIYPLSNEILLLYVNYQYHPLDEDHPHTWAKLYLEQDSIGSEQYFSEENLRFSSLPNQWISTYKGIIAYAHTTDYLIKFYNADFVLMDSIRTDLLHSNSQYLKYIPDGTDYSLDEVKRIGQADDSLLTRIEKIYLLDSTRLLVILKQPRTHFLKYDIWLKERGSWSLTKTQMLPGHYENGVSYNLQNNFVTGFFGNYSGLVYSGNNGFYFVYFPYIENPNTAKFDYQKDYYDKVNELMLRNKLFYGIKKIEISH